MIFRRFVQSLKDQNWTAIAIEFVLLVLGVFLGIQAANWNEARAFDALERDHLLNLRAEIEKDIETTHARKNLYAGVHAAGERALAFIESDQACTGNQCWSLLVDFFHASQWIDVGVNRTTYTEMLRIGLPRSRELALEINPYFSQNATINSIPNERPAYRILVRGLIPLQAQQAMWADCHQGVGGIMTFNNDCPAGISSEQAERAVERIRHHPDIAPTLTQWTSTVAPIVKYLGGNDDYAGRAIAAIDKALESRP